MADNRTALFNKHILYAAPRFNDALTDKDTQYITTETICYYSDLKTSKYKISCQNQHPNTFAAQTKLRLTEHLTASSWLELNTEHIFNYQITKIWNSF